MRLIILSFLLCSTGVVNAQIYKTYDKNGNVIFSDVPSNSAEQVEEKPIAIIPALPKKIIEEKTKPLKKNDGSVPKAYKLTVSGLEQDATLRKEQEAFQAGVQFEPPLHKNHTLLIALDGKDLGKNNFAPKIEPNQLDRGQHRLDIKIVDQNQKTIQTETFDFFIQQAAVAGKKK